MHGEFSRTGVSSPVVVGAKEAAPAWPLKPWPWPWGSWDQAELGSATLIPGLIPARAVRTKLFSETVTLAYIYKYTLDRR